MERKLTYCGVTVARRFTTGIREERLKANGRVAGAIKVTCEGGSADCRVPVGKAVSIRVTKSKRLRTDSGVIRTLKVLRERGKANGRVVVRNAVSHRVIIDERPITDRRVGRGVNVSK